MIWLSSGETGKASVSSPGHCELTELSCLTVQLSQVDGSLLIGTHESDTPGADLDRDAGPADSFARLPIDELKQNRQWNHLVIVSLRLSIFGGPFLVPNWPENG